MYFWEQHPLQFKLLVPKKSTKYREPKGSGKDSVVLKKRRLLCIWTGGLRKNITPSLTNTKLARPNQQLILKVTLVKTEPGPVGVLKVPKEMEKIEKEVVYQQGKPRASQILIENTRSVRANDTQTRNYRKPTRVGSVKPW